MLRVYAKLKLANIEKFVADFGDAALSIQLETGLSARAILGQIALETGWGENVNVVMDENNIPVDTKNLFNITDQENDQWHGPSGWIMAKEYINNKWVIVKQFFRIYQSYHDSMMDYIQLISTQPRYQTAWENRFSAQQYIHEIARAGYATAPDYAQTIISIMRNSIDVRDDGMPD